MVRRPGRAGAGARWLRLTDLRGRRRSTTSRTVDRRSCSMPATTIPAARTSTATSLARTDCWDEVRRVALTAAQVEEYAFPPQPGKETTARRVHRASWPLVQVELDALPPDRCASSSRRRSRRSGTTTLYRRALEQEDRDRRRLTGKKDAMTSARDRGDSRSRPGRRLLLSRPPGRSFSPLGDRREGYRIARTH